MVIMVGTTVHMKETSIAMIDWSVTVDEETCGFLAEEKAKADAAETRGQWRRHANGGVLLSQSGDDDEIERLVDRIFEEGNHGTRLTQSVQLTIWSSTDTGCGNVCIFVLARETCSIDGMGAGTRPSILPCS